MPSFWSRVFSAEKITLWVGVISSIITILLTIWNTHTKSQIDKRETDLKTLEIKLMERTTGIEESKERVDRYKWVLSLFPVLTSVDKKERTFTLNLARLALTKDEAGQLFAGLQSSSDTTLRLIGKTAITAIENEPIATLVAQMNAQTAAIRKNAVASLVRKYSSAPQAITLTLRTLDGANMDNLSSSAIINSLYFLGASEPLAWDRKQLAAARQVANDLGKKSIGAQTSAALNTLNEKLKIIEPAIK